MRCWAEWWLPDYSFPYAVDSGNAASQMRDQAIKAQTGLWGQFITGLTWSRPQGTDEQTYNKALGLLLVNAQQQGQAAVGTPALSFMTGPAGSAMRALDVLASGNQINQGVGKVWRGDTLSGAIDISAGILNATSNVAAQWGITKASRAAQATEVVPNRGENVLPDGLAYRLDLPEHLAGPDGFTKSGQISGTHNLNNATAALDAKGGKLHAYADWCEWYLRAFL